MRDPLRLMRAGLLLGLAALITKLFLADEMTRYMSPSLDPLTALAGVTLGLMGLVELRTWSVGGDSALAGSTSYPGEDGPGEGSQESDVTEQALAGALLLLPILLGLLYAPRGLGTGALGGEHLDKLLLSFGRGASEVARAAPPPPARPIGDVDDLLAYVRQAGEAGLGQQVHVRGLVARSPTLQDDELALLRFSIAHCVADARPVALLVVAPTGAAWPADRWVEVDGVLDVRQRDGDRLMSIIAERIEAIEEPRNPYISPM
jgi:uncharacterized repeat protein (TIGR03943 family)